MMPSIRFCCERLSKHIWQCLFRDIHTVCMYCMRGDRGTTWVVLRYKRLQGAVACADTNL